jgi:hypothetical protein
MDIRQHCAPAVTLLNRGYAIFAFCSDLPIHPLELDTTILYLRVSFNFCYFLPYPDVGMTRVAQPTQHRARSGRREKLSRVDSLGAFSRSLGVEHIAPHFRLPFALITLAQPAPYLHVFRSLNL